MALGGDSAGPLPLPPGLGQEAPAPEVSGSGSPEGGELEPLMRLVYQVDQALDTIARQFPEVSSEIDLVKSSLQDVIATATRNGANPPKKRGLSAMGMDVRV